MIDCLHDVEEASGVITCVVKSFFPLQMPFAGVALPIASAYPPQFHLIGPVVVGNDSVLGDIGANSAAGDVVEGIFFEEVVPEDEDWRKGGAIQIMIPALEHCDQLIAFFSDGFLWEEQKLGLPINVNQMIFPFLH